MNIQKNLYLILTSVLSIIKEKPPSTRGRFSFLLIFLSSYCAAVYHKRNRCGNDLCDPEGMPYENAASQMGQQVSCRENDNDISAEGNDQGRSAFSESLQRTGGCDGNCRNQKPTLMRVSACPPRRMVSGLLLNSPISCSGMARQMPVPISMITAHIIRVIS